MSEGYLYFRTSRSRSLLSTTALSNAIALQEKGADVSILYDDMKVSADELEQDYELARARGVNFLKYNGDLQILTTDVAATVRYWEPFLPQIEQIRLISDYLVLAEDYVPHPDTADLAVILDVRTCPGGFFKKIMFTLPNVKIVKDSFC